MRIVGLVLAGAFGRDFRDTGARQSAGVEDGTRPALGVNQSVGRQLSTLAPRSRCHRWRMANRTGACLERWMGFILWRAAAPSWRMGSLWRAGRPDLMGLCSR